MRRRARASVAPGASLILCFALSCTSAPAAVFKVPDGATTNDASIADASPTTDDGASPQDGSIDGFVTDAGDGPAACVPQVASLAHGQVDVIFVIDSSASMSEELAKVEARMNTFTSTLEASGLDYHVIFVAAKGTSLLQICVPQPLAGANCADNPPKFYHVTMTTFGVQANDSLSLALSTYDTGTTPWVNYVRADAFKVFIEVTDDDARAPYVTTDTFEKQLFAKSPTGMFGDPAKRKYVFNSIVGWKEGTPYQSTTYCTGATNQGLEYQRLSYATGGLIDSVCKNDYNDVLVNFATSINKRLGCDYFPLSGFDPSLSALTYSPGGKPPAVTLPYLTDSSKCAANPTGWYYDTVASPARIVLCPTECEKVLADAAGVVTTEIGCVQPAPL